MTGSIYRDIDRARPVTGPLTGTITELPGLLLGHYCLSYLTSLLPRHLTKTTLTRPSTEPVQLLGLQWGMKHCGDYFWTSPMTGTPSKNVSEPPGPLTWWTIFWGISLMPLSLGQAVKVPLWWQAWWHHHNGNKKASRKIVRRVKELGPKV